MLYKGRETVLCTSVTRMISMAPFMFVVLLAAMENAVIYTGVHGGLIVQGEKASITEFPSMVYLKIALPGPQPYGECGGTIISERWILTAAHCVENAKASDITMRVGSENKNRGGSVRRSSRIIVHKGFFVEETVFGGVVESLNDIALVEAGEPFPLNNLTIKAARLPLRNEDTPPGTIVTTVGWGVIKAGLSTNILWKTNLEIISRQQCRLHVGQITIDEKKLCALDSRKETTICRGDSGGPAFKRDVVVGVTSLGGGNCEPSNFPSIFTTVAYYRDWIQQNSGI